MVLTGELAMVKKKLDMANRQLKQERIRIKELQV
jgi:hypothetical protein